MFHLIALPFKLFFGLLFLVFVLPFAILIVPFLLLRFVFKALVLLVALPFALLAVVGRAAGRVPGGGLRPDDPAAAVRVRRAVHLGDRPVVASRIPAAAIAISPSHQPSSREALGLPAHARD